MNTLTNIPFGPLEVESVSVVKTHLLVVISIIVLSILVAKYILPTTINFLVKRDELKRKEADGEKHVLREGIMKLVENQEIIKRNILEELSCMNKNMVDLKNVFVGKSKTLSKILIIVLISMLGIGCDSDTFTVYKIKKPTKPTTIEVRVSPPDLNPTDAKPVLGGECIPKCTGNTSCVNGRCSGTVITEPQRLGNLYYIEMDKTGTWDPKTQSEEAHYFNGF